MICISHAAEIKPLEKNVDMAKQKVITERANSSRNTNVIVGSVYVITPTSPTLRWKNTVISTTEMSMKIENLKYQDAQCSHPFIPISFIDS